MLPSILQDTKTIAHRLEEFFTKSRIIVQIKFFFTVNTVIIDFFLLASDVWEDRIDCVGLVSVL